MKKRLFGRNMDDFFSGVVVLVEQTPILSYEKTPCLIGIWTIFSRGVVVFPFWGFSGTNQIKSGLDSVPALVIAVNFCWEDLRSRPKEAPIFPYII